MGKDPTPRTTDLKNRSKMRPDDGYTAKKHLKLGKNHPQIATSLVW